MLYNCAYCNCKHPALYGYEMGKSIYCIVHKLKDMKMTYVIMEKAKTI